MRLYRFGYQFLTLFYGLGLKIASLFSHKAKLWVQGRHNWREKLTQGLNAANHNSKPIIWLHAASLGEYEQGKMLLQKYKSENSGYFILVSFFSPSGYEIISRQQRANGQHLIDYCCYLPLDTAKNARDFIQIANPALIIWVKYEFWYYYLHTAAEKKIPIYLIGVIFSPLHIIFSFWGKLTWQMMNFFTKIFTQDSESAEIVSNFLQKQPKDNFYQQHNFYDKIHPAGDTRIDSIAQHNQQRQHLPIIENFIGDNLPAKSPVFIVGSSHGEDLPHLAHILPPLWDKGWKIILVPHEIDPKSIEKTVAFLNNLNSSPLLYSSLENSPLTTQHSPTSHHSPPTSHHSLIIDKIGLLKYAYQYADFAYIGGGFSGGVHNVLEAAVFGLPTAFGGVLHKFIELKQLIKLNAAFHIQPTADNMPQNWLSFIQNSQQTAQKNQIKQTLAHFFAQHQGATDKIYNLINEKE